MRFLWPSMLASLVLLPLLVALYIQNSRRRQRLAAQFGGTGTIGASQQRRWQSRSRVPAGILLVGLAVLLLAAARPQATVSLPRLEGTVILAFDVSGSMAAPDMQPNRMEAAKQAAREFVARMPPTVRVGIVAFSDAGFATQPPTNDQDALLASIERLAIQRGTSLGVGIEAALNILFAPSRSATELTLSLRDPIPVPTPTMVAPGEYSSATIVLLTDGENTQAPDPLLVAQQAAYRGVRIHTVGLGSPEGTLLEIDGFSIRSRLDEATLQQISELTGGTYRNAVSGDELLAIYQDLNPELAVRAEATELTSLFVGAGVILLLAGMGLSMLWLNRVP